MVILDVISPTEKTKGSAALLFMIMVFGTIITCIFLFYMFVSGNVTRLYQSDKLGFYLFLSFSAFALILIVYLYFHIKKRGVWIAEKIGTLIVSDKIITFDSKEEKITIDIENIGSVRLVYGGIDIRVCDDHMKLKPSSVNVVTKDGKTYKWNIVVPNRDAKKQLIKDLETLTKSNSRLIIDDVSR